MASSKAMNDEKVDQANPVSTMSLNLTAIGPSVVSRWTQLKQTVAEWGRRVRSRSKLFNWIVASSGVPAHRLRLGVRARHRSASDGPVGSSQC